MLVSYKRYAQTRQYGINKIPHDTLYGIANDVF
jgi:hypothetical protein